MTLPKWAIALLCFGAIIGVAASINGSVAWVFKAAPPVEVVKPPAQPAAEPPLCPSGWHDSSAKDEHVRVLSCSKGNWTVWLNPDHTFNYAWAGTGPFIFDEAEAIRRAGWVH